MAEQNPLFADGITNGFNSQAMRLLLAASRQAGVVGATDLQVSAGGGTREILVAGGEGMVPDGNGGLYLVPNSASVSSSVFATVAAAGTAPAAPGPIPAAATNPRLDQIVARVWDDSLDSSSLKQWKLAVVLGAETAGVTLANRSGVGALPTKSILLADVITRPGMSTYPTADIRDRRAWARGASSLLPAYTSGNITLGTTLAVIANGSLTPRIECSGAPIRMLLIGSVNVGSSDQAYFTPGIDGTPLDSTGQPQGTTGVGGITNIQPLASAIFTPSPGSHLLSWMARSTAASTTTLNGTAASPLRVYVEEIAKQNANNGLS